MNQHKDDRRRELQRAQKLRNASQGVEFSTPIASLEQTAAELAKHAKAPITLISIQEVAKRLGDKCVRSIRRLMQRQSDFPRPVKNGLKGTVFVEDEIQRFIERKMRERPCN